MHDKSSRKQLFKFRIMIIYGWGVRFEIRIRDNFGFSTRI
jgi:hypothetical protein